MNKNNAADYLPLVQALADGKVIQLKCDDGVWLDIEETKFNFDPSEYRIKPEPREIWVNHYHDESKGDQIFLSKSEADNNAHPYSLFTQVCYREVIE